MGTVTIGVDIGQKHDPTAICVAEAIEHATGRIAHDVSWHLPGMTQCDSRYCRPEIVVQFATRHLERLTLGTTYPDVAARVAGLVAGIKARGIERMELRIDSTGVGAPVVDILRAAVRSEPVQIVAVTFTHGDRYERDGSIARMGKAFLVSRLQVLLQTARIKLPSTAEARTLAEELQNYEIRIDQDANDKYGAFKVGTHDDLVTALGLAVLEDPRRSSLVGAFPAAQW